MLFVDGTQVAYHLFPRTLATISIVDMRLLYILLYKKLMMLENIWDSLFSTLLSFIECNVFFL